jgi:hypothetical protein
VALASGKCFVSFFLVSSSFPAKSSFCFAFNSVLLPTSATSSPLAFPPPPHLLSSRSDNDSITLELTFPLCRRLQIEQNPTHRPWRHHRRHRALHAVHTAPDEEGAARGGVCGAEGAAGGDEFYRECNAESESQSGVGWGGGEKESGGGGAGVEPSVKKTTRE